MNAPSGNRFRKRAVLFVLMALSVSGSALGSGCSTEASKVSSTHGAAKGLDPVYASFFDDGETIHDMWIDVDPAKWHAMQENLWSDDYYEANFTWNEVSLGNIGLRPRGTASRNPQKPGLKFKFNKFVKGQKFGGLESINLRNMWQDHSMLANRLSMSLFRAAGVPTPRENYVRLHRNGEYYGLFAATEPMDDSVFLTLHFGNDKGAMYKGQRDGTYTFEDRGDDVEQYFPALFEGETKAADGPSIRDFVTGLNRVSDEEFGSHVQQVLDVDAFLRHLAIEAFIAEDDGFLGLWGMNNFYLHFAQGDTRAVILPWDKDLTIWGWFNPIWRNAAENTLTRRLFADEAMRERYLTHLEEITALVESGVLAAEYERGLGQIYEAALMDPSKNATNEEFESALVHIQAFIQNRPEQVRLQIAAYRETGDWQSFSNVAR